MIVFYFLFFLFITLPQ